MIKPYLANYGSGNFNYYEISFAGVMRDPGKTDWNINGPTYLQRLSYAMSDFSTQGAGGIAMRLANITNPVHTMLVSDTGYPYPALFNTDYLYNNNDLSQSAPF